jgi:hypothetical protein
VASNRFVKNSRFSFLEKYFSKENSVTSLFIDP